MMQYLTPKKSVKAISDAQKRSDSAQAVAELMFVKAAQAQQLDDASIAKYPEFFVTWDENWRGKAGDIVQDEGKLYRSIHDVTDAGQNRKPSETPSMWTQIGNPLEEFPDWVQPLGAHDAYSKGAKVSHNGEKWTSDVDGNVWEPGVYGWTKYTEPVEARKGPRSPQKARTRSRKGKPPQEGKRQREGRQKPLLPEPKKARPLAWAAPLVGGRLTQVSEPRKCF